jgi:hypothetical protein
MIAMRLMKSIAASVALYALTALAAPADEGKKIDCSETNFKSTRRATRSIARRRARTRSTSAAARSA